MVAAILKSAFRQQSAAWQHFVRKATAVVLSGVLDDVELSCASRAAFLPFLLQVAFLCSCIGPLMIF